MTMRFSTNKYCTSGAEVLWNFFSFMKSASPTGPGWTVRGTSNGLTGGGMVDGNILSASDLSDAEAWFCLRSPNSSMEMLWHRDFGGTVASGEAYYLVNRSVDYTGGTLVALPTSTTGQSKQVYTNATWFPTGYYHFMAQDTAPYNWFFFGTNGATTVGSAGFFSITEGPSGDIVPYIFYGYTGTLSATNLSAGSFAYTPDGSSWGTVPAQTYLYSSTVAFPDNAGRAPSTAMVGAPIFYTTTSATSPAMVKGFITFVRWKSSTAADKTFVDGGNWMCIGSLMVPWNVTDDVY